MTTSPAEERLAERRADLEAWIAGAAGADAVTLRDAKPLKGGAIQENWLVALEISGGPFAGRQDLVLRTDAPSSVEASLSRAQEFRLLRAAAAAGVTVPEPLWLCEDRGVLDRPFYLMRRLAGTAAGFRLAKDPALGGNRALLAERLGRELARIHSITPASPVARELGFLATPRPSPALAAVADPALEWNLRWAELNAPPAGALVLTHQDFRTGNYMVDGQGLTGILDWEFCAWGDPLTDIGWFTAKCWRFGRPELEAGGIAPRADFYRGYEAESGRRIEAGPVAYWELMAHLRWAVIALQQGARYWQRGEPSLEAALTGRIAPELILEALRATAPGSDE
jgi:aminoglycoside phosphotransferase (APT) family kinase protein